MAVLSEKGISYSAGFFILIAMAIGGMMIGGMISMPIIMLMSGQGITAAMDIMNNPAMFREMQVMQTISAVFGFLVPTLFTAYLLSRKPITLTGFTGKITARQIFLTTAIIACGLAISASLAYFSYQIPFPGELKKVFEKLESNYAKLAVNMINLDNPLELIVSIFVLALVPAVCEEALFRGGFQNYMHKATGKLWLSVIVVSLIFSAVHFSAFGFLSRFVLGIILGLLFAYSGKLWLPILAHFINNATAVLVMYFQKSGGKSLEQIMTDKEGSYWGFLAIPVIILLFILFKKASPVSAPDELQNNLPPQPYERTF